MALVDGDGEGGGLPSLYEHEQIPKKIFSEMTSQILK